ncbi:MAG: hypothetical protein ACOC1X_04175 [Promethearchaeota archaeon]
MVNKDWLRSFQGYYIRLKYKDKSGSYNEINGVIPLGSFFDDFIIFHVNLDHHIKIPYKNIEAVKCTLGVIKNTVETLKSS